MTRQEAAGKARALLAQMTVEEKVAQMIQVPYSMVGREEALKWARRGAGSFLHVLGDDAREVQREALATRLGIPVIFGIDAIHGHGLNDHAAIFPTQLAAACSWDPEIARLTGEVTAREVATDGLHWTFSPVLCLGRDTRWGRVNETFGEDPMLAGEMGAAIVKGYQGDDLSDGEHILACAKHYLGYGEAVGARDACDSEITERKMREVFLPPFQKAVEAGCATIMTAYGSQDGTPFTVHSRALRDILRGEFGFDGFVVTDWDNARSLVGNQRVFDNLPDASVATAKAGNDMIMTTLEFYDAMLDALRAGKADIAIVDEAVTHILTIKYEMGLFEKPEKTGRPGCIGCEEHQQAALKAARASVTLLRNDGMLPLAGVKRVAVVGPNADDIRAQYGDWTYFSHPLPDPERTPVRPYVTVKEGMEALCVKKGVECVYARGCAVLPDPADDLDEAVRAAQSADAVILVVGDMIDQVGEGKDRANLDLSGRQLELFERLKATGRPVCTVLVASKPLCLGDAAEQANAVVCAFNGGMFGGQAVAEALFGDINPQGRLPITFPRHSGQLPVYYNQLPGWHGGKYCDLPAEPLFAFGEGMGYTTFAIDGLAFDPRSLTARVRVTNTGARAGVETMQFYARDLVSSVLTPVKRLVAFRQVALEPGKSAEIEVAFVPDDFAVVCPDGQKRVEPGEFELMAGHSSKDTDLAKVTFRL